MCLHTTNTNEEQARLAHYKSLVAHSNLKQALDSLLLLLFSCYICPYAVTCVVALLVLCRTRNFKHAFNLFFYFIFPCYMCPYTATYVSSHYLSLVAHVNLKGALYCKICVLILLHILLYMCPHTATYVSSYSPMCVRILLHLCPHTLTYVSNCSC